MPFYDFECKKCSQTYEEMVSYDATGKYSKVVCPSCGSKSKTKLINAAAFNFKNPVGTDRWTSEDKGHDYRYKHQQPKIRKEREYAEKASHVGPTPYNEIDDVSSGEHFGPVK